MRYAETGVIIEVDLSRGNIEKVETDPNLTRLHLGGQGTADKILWDRVPPEVEPFSPDNLLIFSTGLLHGTPVPGTNRVAVNTFSPQTNLHAHSLFGGWWGPELKHAGYDKIVIRGKASELVYLWIHNDRVEIRDARHLKGKGAQETADLIKKELKQERAQVCAIGPAGENRVFMATIEHANSSAARGVGVIMGDKRLKAIAVRGTKDINIAHPAELWEKSALIRQEIYDNKIVGDPMAGEDDELFHTDNFAWGNARVRKKGYWNQYRQRKWGALTQSARIRETGCYNCPKKCHAVMAMPGRRTYFLKCFNKLTYLMAAHLELDFNYDILAVSQEYGLDGFATPQVIAFALELLQAGILNESDFPGMPEDARGRFFYMIDKIVNREGIGDKLANGVYWAARQIGNGAEVYDHNTTKKFEQVTIKLGKVNPTFFLMLSTGEKMSITQIEGSFPQNPIRNPEERKKFVDDWVAVPNDKYKKIFLEWEKRHDMPMEECCAVVEWNEIMHYIDDAIGLCGFLSSFRGQFGGRIPFHSNNLPELVSLASGLDIDKDTLWEIARRNRTLVRALNVRRGLRRADEKPPQDHWKIRDPKMEQQLLTTYYEYKGWNHQGIPTKKALDALGLDYVSKDLIERGILKENEEASPAEASPAETVLAEADEN
ncbi:putative benzoate-degrading protein BamB [Desulfosarcina cetonica]|nr:aldehyde ferredoxin oxidoreductase N-terminal domain-containing protein [Desulfosarcina cetonica]VTR63825.1 putative benzoate-degrading protein BamB [Desulfosarcina cetonica]